MLNTHRVRAGVLALAGVLTLAALPAASSPAETTEAELVGTVDSADAELGFDWADPIFDTDAQEAQADGAVVTTHECVISRQAGDVIARPLQQYLRRDVRTTGQFVVTPSGNAVLICHADASRFVRSPSQAVVVDNPVCRLPNGQRTHEGQVVLTPSGQLNLTCHVTP
jgi:hypothetical protein